MSTRSGNTADSKLRMLILSVVGNSLEVRRTFACTCTSGLDQSDYKVAVGLQSFLLSTDPRPQPEVARYRLFVFTGSSAVKLGAKGLEQDIP